MTDKQIRYENGCFIIREREFKLLFRYIHFLTEAVNNLPDKTASRVLNKTQEGVETSLSDEEMKDVIALILDVVKLELTK